LYGANDSIDYVKALITHVTKFRERVKLDNRTFDKEIDNGNSMKLTKITDDMLMDLMVSNFNDILYNMIINHHVKENQKKKDKEVIITLLNIYETKICGILDPCLNFIYLHTNKLDNFLHLYRLRKTFCDLYTLDKNSGFYLKYENYDNIYLCSTLYLNRQQNVFVRLYDKLCDFNKDGQFDSFIKYSEEYVTEFLTNIKKIDYLKNIQETTKTIIVKSDSSKKGNNQYLNLYTETDDDNDEKQKKFISSMQEINIIQQLYINKNCNINFEEFFYKSSNLLENVVSPKYLTNVFIGLQKKFLYEISILLLNEVKDDNVIAEVVKNVMNVFKTVCDSAPWILYFIEDNFKSNDTSIIFGLYFSYCGNWEDFITTYCPGFKLTKSDKKNNVKCAIEMITYKLKVNYFKITEQNVSLVTDYNYSCELTYLVYVVSISNTLQTYYNKSEVFLWTHFDWMTTKIFLDNEYKSSSANLLIEKINTLPYKSKFIQSDEFSVMLQWVPTMVNVLNFQKFIFYSMYIKLIGQVYIHWKILSKLKVKVFNKRIYTDKYEKNIKKDIKSFVFLIEELCRKYLLSLNGYSDWIQISTALNKIFLLNYFSDWMPNLENASVELNDYFVQINEKIVSSNMNEMQMKLLLLENCNDAMENMNHIFSFAYKFYHKSNNIPVTIDLLCGWLRKEKLGGLFNSFLK